MLPKFRASLDGMIGVLPTDIVTSIRAREMNLDDKWTISVLLSLRTNSLWVAHVLMSLMHALSRSVVIFWLTEAAFMLILRGQNQRFETLIQNADPKRRSREYCLCFPREEDDFVSMHCALFEAIVRAQVNRKGVYMTSFKRGYMWFCVHASTRISVLLYKPRS